MSVEIGQPAPDFAIETDEGPRCLADFNGKKLVLYFYPKDDTSGCTSQARQFRDDFAQYGVRQAVIVGVSKDSISSHVKFRAKHELPFALGSDENGTLCEAFGVWKEKSMYGRKYMGIERSTFLIDEQGMVRQIWRKVKVTGHSAAVLKAVDGLAG